MAFKFNPFLASFDFVGSGGSFDPANPGQLGLIGQNRLRGGGAAAPVVYRTSDYGNTWQGAYNALIAAETGASGAIEGDASASGNLTTTAWINGRTLVLRSSSDAATRTIGVLTIGGNLGDGATIDFRNINVTSVAGSPVGTLTLVADTSPIAPTLNVVSFAASTPGTNCSLTNLYGSYLNIGLLDVRGAAGSNGTPGDVGSTANGDDGSPGGDDYYSPGGGGEGQYGGGGTEGGGGFAGGSGGDACPTVTLTMCDVGDLYCAGGAGGNGGAGGAGGDAHGGNGGAGGNGLDIDGTNQTNGGNGGIGGNGGTAGNGGTGGDGGNAGGGSNLSCIGGSIINLYRYASGGGGGSAGSGGSASFGYGGSGGIGVNGGPDGSPGSSGSDGTPGGLGSEGSPGNPSNGNYSGTATISYDDYSP